LPQTWKALKEKGPKGFSNCSPKGNKVEDKANWLVKHWPIILVAGTMVIWGVRLEERLAYHLGQPYHDGMRSALEDLIEIKAELRFLREDVQEVKAKVSGSD